MMPGTVAVFFITAILGMMKNDPPGVTCSCADKMPVDSAYKYTDLIIRGRIAGLDTVTIFDGVVRQKGGIKMGRHFYRADSTRKVRVTLVVEDNFKSPFPVPDTVYILTAPELVSCGAHFPPYYNVDNIPPDLYHYIIYAYQWKDYSLVTRTYRKKIHGEINGVVSSNTFVTSSCTRTRRVSEEDMERLYKIRH